MNSRPKNNRGKKGNKASSGIKSLKSQEKQLELALIHTYPKQVCMECWLPATPIKVTTTVTTGAISQVVSVGAGAVTAFNTRFGSTFVEYRVVRAKFCMRLFSSTNPGVIQAWMDEQSTSAPTLVQAQERATLIFNASAIDQQPCLKWVAGDPVDLAYIPLGTVTTPATFKVFSNNANFGSSIVATDYLIIEPEFQFQFRGLQGV